MAVNVGELVAKLKLDTSGFSKGASDAQRDAKGLGSSITSSFSSIGSNMTKFVTLPILALGAGLLKVGGEFDDAFDRIRIGTGQTGAALQGLEQSFRNVVADVPASFEQASIAVTELGRRTEATGPALENLAKQELELARITGTDLAGNIALTTRLFGDWGVETSKQAATLDFLFKTSQQTGVGVDQLAQSVVQFGAPLRAMGFSLEESVAMLGKWGKEGVNSELVLGSLRIAMGHFAKAGVDMREGLDAVVKKIQELGPSAEATALAMKTFGARAGPDMAAAILEGRFAIDELLTSVRNSQDTIISAGKDTADYAEKFQLLKNKIMLAVEPLAGALFQAVDNLIPVFEALVGWVGKAAQWFNDLSPAAQQTVGGVIAVTAAIGPLLIVLGKVGPLLTGMSATLSTLGVRGGPVAIAIAGIAALGIAYATNFGGMRDTVDSFVKFFNDEMTKMSGSTINWGGEVHKAALSIAQGFDIVQHAIRQLIAMSAALAQAIVDSLSGDWTGLINNWKANLAAIEAADAAFMERRKARIDQVNAIDKATHKKHFQELLGLALEGATNMTNAFEKNLNLAPTIEKELRAMHGPVRKEGMAIGRTLGESIVLGHDSVVFRSPYFAVHDLENALSEMESVAKKFKAVGESMGKAMVSGWKPNLDVLLGALNDWSSAVGARLNFTKEMWAKLRDDVKKILSQKAKDHKDLQNTLEQIYIGIAAYPEKLSTAAKKALDILTPINQKIIKQYDDVGKALSKTADVTGAAHALMIDAWLAHERAADEAADAIKTATEKMAREIRENLTKEFERLSRELPASWNKIIDGILNGSKRLGSDLLKLGVTIKGWAADIIGVVGTLPGKFGDAARGVLSTIDQWVLFADKVLAVLHRINSSIPGSIEDMISVITGGLTKAQKTVEAILDDIFGPVIKNASVLDAILDEVFGPAQGVGSTMTTAAGQVERSSSRMVNAITAIGAAAMFAGAAIGGRTGAVLSGAGAGASLGAQIGFVFGGPTGAGIGAVVGAAAGAIAGFFGSRQSDAQKKAEEDAIKQAQQRLAQGAIDIIKGGLEVFNQALDVLFKAADYTGTPRKMLRKLAEDTKFLIQEFFNILKTFAHQSFAQAKEFAEALGPAIQLLGAALQLFEAVRNYTKVPEQAIKDLISDFTILEGLLEIALEDVELKVVKKISKVSAKLMNGFELLKLALEVIKSVGDYKPVDASIFDAIFADLYTLVTRFEELAEEFKRFALAKTKKTAEQMASIVESFGSSLAVLKSIGEYQKIGVEVFATILDDLRAVLGWQDEMIALADEGIAKGLTFEERMAEWGASIARGLSALASIAGGSFNVTAGSGLSASAFAGGSGLNSLALPGGGGALGSSLGSTGAPVNVYLTVQGSVFHDEEMQDIFIEAYEVAQSRGRVAAS